MDEIDRKILSGLENGLTLTREPFKEIAARLEITPEEVVGRLIKLKKSGVIRRFGASMKPNNLGFSANAMVAWNVPENRVQEVGTYLSSLPEITHCYERKTVDGKWAYNLYMVTHARERQIINLLVDRISRAITINEYKILFSTKELKKTNVSLKNTAPFPAKASLVPSKNFRR